MVLLMAACVTVKLVVGNAVQPGAERRKPLEAADAHIGLDERLLRQVVGQHLVARGQVQQEPAHARLIGLDEPAECVPVVGQGALRQQSYFIKLGKHVLVTFSPASLTLRR